MNSVIILNSVIIHAWLSLQRICIPLKSPAEGLEQPKAHLVGSNNKRVGRGRPHKTAGAGDEEGNTQASFCAQIREITSSTQENQSYFSEVPAATAARQRYLPAPGFFLQAACSQAFCSAPQKAEFALNVPARVHTRSFVRAACAPSAEPWAAATPSPTQLPAPCQPLNGLFVHPSSPPPPL